MAISHRLFFAIQPLKLQRIQIGHRRDERADVHRPVVDEDLHLTLAVTTIYDDFPTDVARTLRALGSAIMGEPAIISLERLAATQKSVALRPRRPSRELRALQKALAEPMARKDLLLPGYNSARTSRSDIARRVSHRPRRSIRLPGKARSSC